MSSNGKSTPETIAAARPETDPLREQLRAASRQASMAEVATTALHNVGNVITSVNVSVSLVANQLRQSRLHNLTKAVALFRQHRQDLANYLAQDPKGKLVPGYLETLAEHLTAEHDGLVREIDSLSKNIEHIKEIVAVQQSYARQCGATETLQMADLVHDAVRMNLGAFERHGVTIRHHFETVPPVTVDKHKVLQILINLMRNAKYAMDELSPAPPQKNLLLSITQTSPDTVAVLVEDNGIGIAAEHMPHLFEQGFTTKKDGHGVGLYSGYVAARELGGKLTARSAGIGKGAVFCLELPAASQLKQSIVASSGVAQHA